MGLRGKKIHHKEFITLNLIRMIPYHEKKTKSS